MNTEFKSNEREMLSSFNDILPEKPGHAKSHCSATYICALQNHRFLCLATDRCGTPCCSAWLGLSALVMSVCAIAFPIIIQNVIQQQFAASITLSSPNDKGYAHFIDETYESNVTQTFYFWNLENPNAVLQGAKPNMTEVGPFVYRVETEKSDVSWTTDQTQVTYRLHTERSFDSAQTHIASGGRIDSDTVEITSLNMVFLGARVLVGDVNWEDIYKLIDHNDTDRLFKTRSARDWIYGYKQGAFSFPGLFPNVEREDDPDFTLPTTLWTGVGDLARAKTFVKYRNSTLLQSECPYGTPFPFKSKCESPPSVCCFKAGHEYPQWASEAVNDIHDLSNADSFPAPLDSSVDIFSDALQRKITFTSDHVYDPTLTYKGVHLSRYLLTNATFENEATNPDHARFYMHGPDGVINLTRFERGAPIFTSRPHFLWADPALRKQVLGMNPDSTKHTIELWVEPLSGITMMELERQQINIRVTADDVFHNKTAFGLDRVLYVPMCWFTFEQHINDKTGAYFSQIYLLQQIGIMLPVALGIVALALLVLMVATISGRHRMKANETNAAMSYNKLEEYPESRPSVGVI